MSKRPCLSCGRLVSSGSYCPGHAPRRANRQTPGRGGGWQAAKFRSEVLRFAGYVCQRCGADGALQAHHVRPLVEGGTNDPANGVALCRRCHEAVERVVA